MRGVTLYRLVVEEWLKRDGVSTIYDRKISSR